MIELFIRLLTARNVIKLLLLLSLLLLLLVVVVVVLLLGTIHK